jgi:DNA-directed RNA polymerase specialized sigma24 family protein
MRADREQAFAAVFDDEYPRVVRLAYVMLGDEAAARDVAQEAFARLYSHWRRVSDYEFIGAWVRRVAVRLAVAAATQRSREVAHGSLPDTGSMAWVPDVDVHAAVLALPAKQRAAVVLFYFEDRSVDATAAVMGISPSTAKVHLHRARQRLAEMLGEEIEDVAR